ncbi:MAG: DUF3987 domain-containing protein, partial [Blastocatellia bacterium]
MRWLIEHWKGEGWDYDEKSGDVWLEFDEGGIHIAVIKGGSVTFKSDAVNGFYEGDRFPVAQVARRLSGGKVGAVKAIEVKAEPIMAKPLLVASPVIPFPVEVFPPVLGKYIQSCAESLDCDPAMVGAPLLCSLAAAIGNSAVVRVKDGFEQPAVLWCMVVAESGSAKSPAADHGLRPLRQVNARFAKEDQRDQAEYRKEKVQHEARSQEWRQKQEGAPPDEPPRPASKMLIVNDATVEGIVDRLSNTPRGLLMDADELSGFLGSLDRYAKGKGADASSYMTFYEARDLTVTRKGQGTVMIPRAHVNIFGTIQPGVVERYLDAMHDEMGFSARFLVVYPERRPMVFNTRGVPAELLEGVEALVEKLARDPGIGEDHRSVKPRVFTVAVDAVSDYKTLQDRLNREAVEDGGILARHLAKLGPATLRFALIIHCCRRALGEKVGEQIDSDSMRAARRLEEYFECQIRRLCDERGLDPSEQRDNRELG